MRYVIGALAVTLVMAAPPLNAQQSTREQQTTEDIRSALLRLPYYGVFDFLAFQYERGAVTLSGFVYQPSVKRAAVDAVKRVAGVDDVVDRIEELPVSQYDDDIRWRTFDRIYRDTVLARYAPGGGFSRYDRFNMRLFPGMQPFGTYGIHIIVKGGRTTLIGVVDSEFDRNIAGVRAREVPGTFGVENELVVAQRNTRPTRSR